MLFHWFIFVWFSIAIKLGVIEHAFLLCTKTQVDISYIVLQHFFWEINFLGYKTNTKGTRLMCVITNNGIPWWKWLKIRLKSLANQFTLIWCDPKYD